MTTSASALKLRRFGKGLGIATKVLSIISFVVAGILLVSLIFALVVPWDTVVMNVGEVTVNVHGMVTQLTDQASTDVNVRAIALSAISLGIIDGVFFGFIMGILSRLFKDTAAHETPFLSTNVRRLKSVGWLLIANSFAMGIATAIVEVLTHPVTSAFDTGNGGYLITGLVIFALAYVFQYGCELQQAADETL
ncbi:MAG: DUF2975 domain-containing protein [Actinomycetes bacterium]|jgi:hypothetical protein|nr:DUF2975 domain-containing protein [Actinomycetes bacterium]